MAQLVANIKTILGAKTKVVVVHKFNRKDDFNKLSAQSQRENSIIVIVKSPDSIKLMTEFVKHVSSTHDIPLLNSISYIIIYGEKTLVASSNQATNIMLLRKVMDHHEVECVACFESLEGITYTLALGACKCSVAMCRTCAFMMWLDMIESACKAEPPKTDLSAVQIDCAVCRQSFWNLPFMINQLGRERVTALLLHLREKITQNVDLGSPAAFKHLMLNFASIWLIYLRVNEATIPEDKLKMMYIRILKLADERGIELNEYNIKYDCNTKQARQLYDAFTAIVNKPKE